MKTAEAQACEDYPPGFNPSDLIDQKWWELKNNGLDLGWPGGRANLMPSPYGTTGTAGYFPNGTIYNSGYGVYEVHGAIVSVYKSMGGPASWLGFPVSDEYNDPASVHRRSDFEGGYIAYEDGIGGYTAFVTPHILEGGFGAGSHRGLVLRGKAVHGTRASPSATTSGFIRSPMAIPTTATTEERIGEATLQALRYTPWVRVEWRRYSLLETEDSWLPSSTAGHS